MDEAPKIIVVDIQHDFSGANLVRKMIDTPPLPIVKISDLDDIIMTDAARELFRAFQY